MDVRLPPHDLDAERALLGSVLFSNAANVPDLPAEAFYRAGHGVIWRAVQALLDRGEPADIITTCSELSAAGLLEKAGGAVYVTGLTGSAIPAHAGEYARLVREHHARRKAILEASRVIEDAYAGAPVAELLDQLHGAANAITPRNARLADVRTIARDVVAELERLYEAGEPPGLSTGFPDLDRQTRLHPGEVTVIGGRPGMGKTAFALDITRAALFDGRRVFWASLEMTRERLVTRLLATLSGIEGRRFRTGRFEDRDWPKLTHALGRLVETRLWIDDTPGTSSGHIRAEAERIASKEGLDLVVLDYVQLVEEPGDWAGNKRQEVARVSRAMVRLAKTIGAHVVMLAQLNRQVEARRPPRPQLSDLKEAGDLEQDADNVLLLYRPEYYEKADCPPEKRGLGEVEVAKCREGRTGVVEVAWRGEVTSYAPLARQC